jgi:hypothetical protein
MCRATPAGSAGPRLWHSVRRRHGEAPLDGRDYSHAAPPACARHHTQAAALSAAHALDQHTKQCRAAACFNSLESWAREERVQAGRARQRGLPQKALCHPWARQSTTRPNAAAHSHHAALRCQKQAGRPPCRTSAAAESKRRKACMRITHTRQRLDSSALSIHNLGEMQGRRARSSSLSLGNQLAAITSHAVQPVRSRFSTDS